MGPPILSSHIASPFDADRPIHPHAVLPENFYEHSLDDTYDVPSVGIGNAHFKQVADAHALLLMRRYPNLSPSEILLRVPLNKNLNKWHTLPGPEGYDRVTWSGISPDD